MAPQQDGAVRASSLPNFGLLGRPAAARQVKYSLLDDSPASPLQAPGPNWPVLATSLRVRLNSQALGPILRVRDGDLGPVIQPDAPRSEEKPAPVPTVTLRPQRQCREVGRSADRSP